MRPCADGLFAALEWALVRAASLAVPRAARDEWRREWDGELCHVREVYRPPSTARWLAWRFRIEFCVGAFSDARCMRRLSRRQKLHFPAAQGSPAGSPVACLLVLAAILSMSFAAARLLPGVRAERALAPAVIGHGLVLIQDAEDRHAGEPTIASFQVRSWRQSKQDSFDGFAFYYVAGEELSGAGAASGAPLWRIAHATPNLLTMLEAPVRLRKPASAADAALPALVLSESGFKRRMNADPRVVGRVVNIGGHAVRIAGVAPDGLWHLPGEADAWLLDPDAERARGVLGYAVAHLTPAGRSLMRTSRIGITAYRSRFGIDSYEGIALYRGSVAPWPFFLFATLLALFTLPVITPVERAELSLHAGCIGWLRLLMRPAFFAAKLALLWPIAYFVSLDVAYSSPLLSVAGQTYLQLATGFLICLFGLRGALADQHRRCPVCLRLVTHPAHVGLASNTFLGWNGTEMICTGGHTLLHIPSLPMSWFSTPRWLFREPVWKLLLGETAQK